LNRRAFLGGLTAAGSGAGALTSCARVHAAQPAACPHHPTDLIKGFRRQSLRVGFERILDPTVGEKEPWYVNDHCFIRAADGTWHVFGITASEPAKPYEEKFFLHATAPAPRGPWTKQAPVMHFDPKIGETVVWAPYVLAHDGRYWMYYCGGGNDHARYRIHLATSRDLNVWERHPANPMVVDGFDARDPMVLRVGDEWVMYYTANETPAGGQHVVAAVTSNDLVRWSNKKVVFRSLHAGTSGGPTESPFVVERGGKFYLFVCTNTPYNDTAVYESTSPFEWSPEDIVATFPAHAAEVIRSDGRWFVSAAGWGQGGIYLAELHWD
jgi:hypothetical protein